MNFKKIRVSTTKESKQNELFKKRRQLKKKDDNSKVELDEVVSKITELAEDKYKQVMEDLNNMRPREGKMNSQHFWKMTKIMYPTNIEPLSAMYNTHENILTSYEAIKARAIEVYTDRLRGNQIKVHVKNHEEDVDKLCEARIRLSKVKKVEPWNMEYLNMALKDLDISLFN